MLERLSKLRKQRKWSLQETADQLGIAKSTYAGYESGYREPSLHSLVQIADLFDVSIDFLLGKSNQEKKPIDIAGLTIATDCSLTVDGQALSKEELLDFIAFVRAKRMVREKKQEKGDSSGQDK